MAATSNLSLRLTLGLVAWLGAGGTGLAQDHGRAADLNPRFHVFVAGKTGMTIRRVLEGARRRLSTTACQRLLDDFTDETGRPLALRVASLHASPPDLIARLYFVDGDDTIQCRANKSIAAFTAPGSHVVFVCQEPFQLFARDTTRGELLLIHEFLHALGLGENPPTVSQIARAVMNRCK